MKDLTGAQLFRDEAEAVQEFFQSGRRIATMSRITDAAGRACVALTRAQAEGVATECSWPRPANVHVAEGDILLVRICTGTGEVLAVQRGPA